MVTWEDLDRSIEVHEAERWEKVAATMRAAGFDPDKGCVLFMPTSCVATHIKPPAWVIASPLHADPIMAREDPRKLYARPEPPKPSLYSMLTLGEHFG